MSGRLVNEYSFIRFEVPPMKAPVRLAFIALSVVACTQAQESSPNEPVEPAGETYHSAIKAIIDDKCVSCHHAGGIGPLSFETFADVQKYSASIRDALESGSMPPWPAADDCNDYANDRSLDDASKTAVLDWIARGTPEGEPGTGPEGQANDGLSRVDRTLTMTVDYTPNATPDDYRCFLLDWNEPELTYVTGFRAAPGNQQTVHHVIAYLIPPNQVGKYNDLDADDEGPGYTCFGGPGGGLDQDTKFIGSWAPGSAGGDLPAGTGIPVQPGSKIALQVHYNAAHGSGPDRSGIELKLDSTVEKEGNWQFFTNVSWVLGSGMDIEPMTSDVTHSYKMDPTPFVSGGDPITIHAVGLHMHTLGQTATLSVERAAQAGEVCLLDIPQWDFNWQGSYDLTDPFVLSPGDQLAISCTWDNPTPNHVSWGEGTGDEMCLGLIYYTVP
jgi:hypothetical protein